MKPIKPMLAISGNAFNSKDWIFEPKIDGTRCIAHLFDDVELQNRRLIQIDYRYPELVNALQNSINPSDRGTILDGEIALFSNDVPNFNALAQREHQIQKMRIDYLSKTMPASYLVFDILFVRGENVMHIPLAERKKLLEEVLEEGYLVTIMDYVQEIGTSYFRAAVKMGVEGIMAKRKNSEYQPGVRSPSWVKIKKNLTADLVIGGYIPGKGHREPYFGSLLIGAYESKNLIYLGRVGSGFSELELDDIRKRLTPTGHSPFADHPQLIGAVWVKPELVAEVSILEVTSHGHLRAPVFHRIREDKTPQECGIDQLQR